MKHLKLFFALFAMLALGVTNAWGAESKQVTLDFTSNSWGFPSASSNKTTAEKTYTSGDYSIKLAGGGSGNGHYYNTSGYLMLGKNGATLTLPAFDFTTTKIVITGKLGASTSVKQNIYVGSTEVSTATTGAVETNTYLINSSYQAAGNVYVLKVTSAHNTQITKIEIYGEAGGSTPPTPPTTYTIKWHTAVGTTTDVTLNEGATITKPATDPTMTGYTFMGWTDQCNVATDGDGFTPLTNFGTADSDKDFYAVFAVAETTGGESTTTEVTDVLNRATTGVTNTSYATWSGKTATSSAVYAGQSAGGNSSIQLRSNSSNSGIVTTASGGKAKKVVVVWQSSTTSGRTIDIYGKNSAYTQATDLYSSTNQGTKLGSIKCGTSTELTISGDYEYIGIRSNSGALYLTSVSITWASEGTGGGTTTYDNYITTCASDIEFVELGDAFKWSATEAEVTIDATDNVFPTLTNTHNVPVKYSSSDDAIATIAADGTVTLKTEGTVTITAKYEGGTSAGTGKEYKAKTVTYSLKVNKAVAQPTGTMYVKVTDAVTDGEYLIVYETGKVAFNGALDALDVASNTVEVTISDNVITGNTDIDKALFTIDATNGTVLSASGKYIGGKSSNENGINISETALENDLSIDQDDNAVIASNGKAIRYNKTAGQTRFRYFKDNGGTQEKIQLYKKVDPNAVVEPQFKLAAGEYYGTQSVEITCATTGAEIYYTLNGTDPTSASTKYTGAISIASTTTIKAVAIKGENSSVVVSATYTILAPLATMQAIFDKATAVGGTATPVHITMNNWVVTGIKNNNVYVTDGTKGLIIYTASHGFNVGDILSGTVACKVQLYNGSSELTELTSTTEGLTVSTGGVVTPVVVNDVTTLGGVNTGSVIKITGPCTVDGTKYYVAGVQLFNSLYTYTNPEEGYNYECTGVYLQYNTTKEILPRKAEDLVKIETQQPAGIKFETTEYTANVNEAFTAPTLTNPNGLTVAYSTSDATLATVNATTGEVTILNKTGKVTITASFAGNEDYVAATASYNITISDPNLLEATFVAGTNKSDELSISKNGVTVEFTGGTFSRDDNYRCYANQSMTISYNDGQITKIVFTCDGSSYGPDKFSTETVTYSYSGSVGTWVGDAKSVTFAASAQVRMTDITVYYKQDKRANAELAWSEESINLTIGDAFTAPTFNNPNNLAPISFNSDNTALAIVNNAGVISLKAGAVGTATITAKYAGNETYKDAEVSCTITVNPKTEDVVIVAQREGKWYALKAATGSATNSLAALEVEYINGVLYNVNEADKASITWKRTVVGNLETFQYGDKYLKGSSSTNLFMEEGAEGKYQWDKNAHTMLIGSTNRTFLYQGTYFKNYAISNAGKTVDGNTYSALPVVTAAKFENANIITRDGLTTGNYGTICYENNITNYEGAVFYEVVGKEGHKIILDEVTELEAGMPYIYCAEAGMFKVAVGNETATEAGKYNSLQGTFVQIEDGEAGATGNRLEGNYIIYNNYIKKCGAKCGLVKNRAYFIASEMESLGLPPAQAPERRRVAMGYESENQATGVDNITENGVVAPALQGTYDIMGRQLADPAATGFYIVDGKKVFVVK